jgi:hypothetical protein
MENTKTFNLNNIYLENNQNIQYIKERPLNAAGSIVQPGLVDCLKYHYEEIVT